MSVSIPEPLQLEHNELHEDLVRATKAGGQVGEAARVVARVLHNHFLDEEAFAMPPRGVLSQVAARERPAEAEQVLAMTERSKAELPRMLSEHGKIVAALQSLIAAAQAEGRPEFVRFAEKFMLHARTEEEVLYPAAILIGEYLKLKTGTPARAPL
jgi:hypothetical protein